MGKDAIGGLVFSVVNRALGSNDDRVGFAKPFIVIPGEARIEELSGKLERGMA